VGPGTGLLLRGCGDTKKIESNYIGEVEDFKSGPNGGVTKVCIARRAMIKSRTLSLVRSGAGARRGMGARQKKCSAIMLVKKGLEAFRGQAILQ